MLDLIIGGVKDALPRLFTNILILWAIEKSSFIMKFRYQQQKQSKELHQTNIPEVLKPKNEPKASRLKFLVENHTIESKMLKKLKKFMKSYETHNLLHFSQIDSGGENYLQWEEITIWDKDRRWGCGDREEEKTMPGIDTSSRNRTKAV
ncbi:MAG: hypothetical protein MHMPM18_002137 [Marteilia pararefringens]